MDISTAIPPSDSTAAMYRWTIALSERLAQMRLAFHGDLDAFLIFLVFASDVLHRSRLGPRSADQAMQPSGINALSVSEITGIPRETARRKLQSLIAIGCIARDGAGLYRIDPQFNLDRMLDELGAGARRPPHTGALIDRMRPGQDAGVLRRKAQ